MDRIHGGIFMRFDVHDDNVRVRVTLPTADHARLIIDYPSTDKYRRMVRRALADLLARPEYRPRTARRAKCDTTNGAHVAA